MGNITGTGDQDGEAAGRLFSDSFLIFGDGEPYRGSIANALIDAGEYILREKNCIESLIIASHSRYQIIFLRVRRLNNPCKGKTGCKMA